MVGEYELSRYSGEKVGRGQRLKKSDVNVNWNIFFRPISNIEYQNNLRDVEKSMFTLENQNTASNTAFPRPRISSYFP